MADQIAAAPVNWASLTVYAALHGPSAGANPNAALDSAAHVKATAKGEPLALQFEAFLSSVESRSEPKLNGGAARRTLEVALAILDKMKEHSEVVAQSLVTGWTP